MSVDHSDGYVVYYDKSEVESKEEREKKFMRVIKFLKKTGIL